MGSPDGREAGDVFQVVHIHRDPYQWHETMDHLANHRSVGFQNFFLGGLRELGFLIGTRRLRLRGPKRRGVVSGLCQVVVWSMD